MEHPDRQTCLEMECHLMPEIVQPQECPSLLSSVLPVFVFLFFYFLTFFSLSFGFSVTEDEPAPTNGRPCAWFVLSRRISKCFDCFVCFRQRVEPFA